MRLTIDTATDKPEDIQRAIKLLMGLVGSKVYHNTNEEPKNYWDNIEQPKQEMQMTPEIGNLMSMFDAPTPTNTPITETTQTAQELIDDLPKIELY